MNFTIEDLIDFLAENLSDLDTGALSDTPYVSAELESDGMLSLFKSGYGTAIPDASIDLPQLAGDLVRWIKNR